MKKLLCSAAAMMAISASAFLPMDAVAQVNINLVVPQAPPQVIYEAQPAARNGYLWAPGYWNWNGNRFVWASGHWERVRPQYVYEAPQWQEENGAWRFNRGGWKRGKHGGHHDERDHEGESDHRGERGDHCPPGQAKKGNC